MYPIIPAQITLDAERTPRSITHDDIYFLPAHGIAESNYVFIDGNHLPARFRNTSQFTVAELGLGTGLNLTLTLRAWRHAAPQGARLTYISIEKHPIDAHMLAQIHEGLGIAEETAEWRAAYPLPIYGAYPIVIEQEGVEIVIMWMDAADACMRLAEASVDAWFLDGFAPDKNPDMWNADMCAHVVRTLKKGGSVSTFTAAGKVRRALAEAGLQVERIKGYGAKRHMVVGSKK
jgi:tRNA 5-methylaminomethyl-2-thiouridine biosynthesis bifunctional protein